MTRFITPFVTAAILMCSGATHAIESLAFEVLEKNDSIEVRRYASHMLATVRVAADFDEAGSKAFRPLFDFISGDNANAEKIAMTAPVIQQPSAESGQWLISFVMPSDFNRETLPVPSSALVNVSEQPPMLMAALQYRGGWSQSRYQEHEAKLIEAMNELSLAACGESRWARHDPPFMPWFLRKNEILIPLCDSTAAL